MNSAIEYAKTCMSEPTLIYLSIGCANNGKQQCPRFVREWNAKHKICILMDPALETPLSCEPLLDSSIAVLRFLCDFETTETVAAVAHWGSTERTASATATGAAGSQFIHDLCQLTLSAPRAHLIVQEYTGRNSDSYYPLAFFGYPLLKRALFGITYGESSCFLAFSKVHILRDEAGDFVQPRFLPLLMTVAIPHYAKERLYEDATQRMNAIRLYIHRLYRIQLGREEPRDWCTPTVVAQHMKRLTQIYGVRVATDPDTLLRLSEMVLNDFCAAAGTHMSVSEITALLEDKTGERLGAAMAVLRDAAVAGSGSGPG
jgi:hypothetical protein